MFEQELQALNTLLNHLDAAFKKGSFGLMEAAQITDATRTLMKFHEEGVVEVANRVVAGVEANQAAAPEPTFSTQAEPQLAQPPITEILPPTVEAPHIEVSEEAVEKAVEASTKPGKPQRR